MPRTFSAAQLAAQRRFAAAARAGTLRKGRSLKRKKSSPKPPKKVSRMPRRSSRRRSRRSSSRARKISLTGAIPATMIAKTMLFGSPGWGSVRQFHNDAGRDVARTAGFVVDTLTAHTTGIDLGLAYPGSRVSFRPERVLPVAGAALGGRLAQRVMSRTGVSRSVNRLLRSVGSPVVI